MLQNNADRPLHVLLLTEGTYPFHWGGVSTWCHLLIRDLPEVQFTLFGIAADPQLKPQFTLPENVVEFRKIPLWGIREVLESSTELSLSEIRRRRWRTTPAVVISEFIPSFRAFLKELFISDTQPEHLGKLLHQMYRFFQSYDFDTSMRSRATWDCFVQAVQEYFPQSAAQYGYPGASVNLSEITTANHWLYHWLIPLAIPVPHVDVAHASMAGMCTMICVVAKLEHGAGFMLTEHGIYLRERYLAEAASSNSFFHKLFNLRFARRMTDLSYALADQISPCCDYNQRWELRNGASLDRLRTIYYGADSGQFVPAGKPVGDPPVVVWVGRINPLKDVFTLLRAAALVQQSRPDIQFRLYGNSGAEEKLYHAECLALHAELGLADTVVFAGHTSKPADAYNEGDVVVLSSISEGFPFATLEAMLCGKPVVATSVGGLPEQIEGCGIVVEPRNPEEMAQAILNLMNDPERCAELGRAAREKAVLEFNVRQSGDAHISSYERLAGRWKHVSPGVAGDETVSQAAAPATEDVLIAAPLGLPASQLVDELGVYAHATAVLALADRFVIGEVAASVVGPAALAERALSDDRPSLRQLVAGDRIDMSHAAEWQPQPAQTLGLVPVLDSDPRLPPIGQRKRRIAPPNERRSWLPRDPAALRALAAMVIERDPQPIDYLEVTAVIESLGITDEVAINRYGAPHSFGLAETVLEIIKTARPPLQESAPAATSALYSRKQAMLDYARGPVALLPGLILLLVIESYRWLSAWEPNQVLALSVGFTSSMLLSNGFIQGITRRGSLYIGTQNMNAARQYLRKGLLFAGACLLGFAVLAILVTTWLGVLTLYDRFIFGLAFVALSTIWLLASVLVFKRAQIWLGLGLAAGLLVGVAVDRLVAPFSAAHLLAGSLAGFATTLAVIIRSVRWLFGSKPFATKQEQAVLPASSYLIYEAAPYYANASLYTLFVLVPHLIGGFGALAPGQQRLWAIFSQEGGYTLAMPPLLLAAGVAEHGLRLFWKYLVAMQARIDGHAPQRFRSVLLEFYERQLRRYLIALALLSLAAYAAVRLALATSLLRPWLGIQDDSMLLFVLQAALVAYYLLGWGMFNYMFIVSLDRPGMALRGVLLGLAVITVAGVPLSLGLHFSYAAVAFIAGSLAYCIASSFAFNRMIQSADYYYYSAL